MPLLYHKRRRLSANPEDLECMAWDVMRKIFHIDLLYCEKDFYSFRKALVIFHNALVIFHNPFHCRYKDYIYYSLLSFILASVFRLYLCL